MGIIVDQLKSIYNISEHSIELLISKMEITEHKKGDVIIEVGQRSEYIFIVDSGLLKGSFMRDNKERILNFAFEGELATLPINHSRNSRIRVEALEDTVIYKIKQKELENIIVASPELTLWGYKQMKIVIEMLGEYYMDFAWMDKKDQYHKIVERHPTLLQRVSLKDIASYLNITQSSLSRIRATTKL